MQGNQGRGCVESTISKYLSRVFTYHRECGLPQPVVDCDKLRIERLFRGIERLGAQPRHRRRAITAEIILRMLAAPCCDPTRLESASRRFYLVLAFFALLRRGDVFAATAASFDPRLDLCVGDFRLDRDQDGATLVVNLKCCKGDRAARGQDVVLGERNGSTAAHADTAAVCPAKQVHDSSQGRPRVSLHGTSSCVGVN